MLNNVDTNRIIEGCRKGETYWQKQLYDCFAPRLYAICKRYAVSTSMADDILMDSFVQIFQSIGQYTGKGAFEGWLRSIVVHKALLYLKRYNRQGATSLSEEPADPTTPLEQQLALKEALEAGLAKVPINNRTAFNLVEVEGYTIKEASRLLDIPESTVKTRLYRAKEKLQQFLQTAGYL